MSFGAPEWLWLLALVPVWAALLAWFLRLQRRRLLRLASSTVVERVTLVRWPALPWVRWGLLVAGVLFAIVAAARPRWGIAEESLRTVGLDIVIAIDASNSMLAEDVAPSRLTVARVVARELSRALHGDRVALVAFAGTAARMCPLTADRDALELYLDALDPSLFPQQGTDLGTAVQTALAAFGTATQTRRVLVLISDGEDHEQALETALKQLDTNPPTIYTVGIGTPEGAPLPQRNEDGKVTGYRTDRDGHTVTSRLEEAALQSLARAGHGAYVRVTSAANAARDVSTQIARLERTEREERLPARRAERYRWPLAAALLLLVTEAALVAPRREVV
jgi:Ca-activated chloride channel family protein